VAAHVEHILHKLEVPTRTLAAVQAERDGCYVPAALLTAVKAPGLARLPARVTAEGPPTLRG
jgi:hypothetical protein